MKSSMSYHKTQKYYDNQVRKRNGVFLINQSDAELLNLSELKANYLTTYLECFT
jgi:hypothetical protein